MVLTANDGTMRQDLLKISWKYELGWTEATLKSNLKLTFKPFKYRILHSCFVSHLKCIFLFPSATGSKDVPKEGQYRLWMCKDSSASGWNYSKGIFFLFFFFSSSFLMILLSCWNSACKKDGNVQRLVIE